MHNSLKFGFAGTPAFAATILQKLIAADYIPLVVYTQPDRPTGRGRKLAPSPVKLLALANGIEVRQPISLKTESLLEDQLDLLIVAAYGLLLPAHILQAPASGCVNVHASLLPRWRGAAPVERAIIAGDVETGVCLMRMDEGLDTGDIYLSQSLPISENYTGASLEAALADLGAQMLIDALPDVSTMMPKPQSVDGATYAKKLTSMDSVINWQQDVNDIARRVRALCERAPMTCYTAPELAEERKPVRVRILQAGILSDTITAESATQAPGTVVGLSKAGLDVCCGTGTLRITRLQINRGKGSPLSAADLLNGYPTLLSAGSRLYASPI